MASFHLDIFGFGMDILFFLLNIMFYWAVNCMYWEKRFPRLLTNEQLQGLMSKGCPLVGFCDITCDIGGSLEFVNQTTSIDSPFFRYHICRFMS